MNSKEEAKALVNEFYSIISGLELNYISSLITFPNGDSHFKTAKQCAIIAVDEIIKSSPHKHITDTWVILNIDYWNEVKTEIQNL